MWKSIRSFFSDLSDAQQAVITIIGVVVVVAGGWGTALAWLKNLSIASIIWYSVAIFALLCIFIFAFISWWLKHDVDKIPNLLCRLNDMALTYVKEFDVNSVPPEDSAKIVQDLGEYLNINVARLSEAFKSKNPDPKTKRMGEYEMKAIKENTERLIDPKNKTQDSLKLLLLISGIMNEHGVGLDKLKSTPNYKSIYDKIQKLQTVVPNVKTNIRINEYFNWSTGYYSYLLGRKFTVANPNVLARLSVVDRVTNNIIVPQIEASTIILISAVRESLLSTREKESNDGKQ